jgi:hypothetical protein
MTAGADVGFENMAKTIAKRWRELTQEELEPFQKLAREDMVRYRREMEEYQQELVRQSRIGRERAAAEANEFEQRRAAEAAASALDASPTAPLDVSARHSGSYQYCSSTSFSRPSSVGLQEVLSALSSQHDLAPNALPSNQQGQAIYANAVLAHLDSLLQQEQQRQGSAPASSTSAADASSGGLGNAAASSASQVLMRQPWSLGSLPSAAPNMHNPMPWSMLGIQQQLQQSLLQRQQLEAISNATQVALLQHLLGLPSTGASTGTVSGGSRLSGHPPSPSSSENKGADESSSRDDAPGDQK